MGGIVREVLTGITTVGDIVAAFEDEDRCRRLLEAMIWPRGRICPACGYRNSTSLAGRDVGRRARPGLYQCSNGGCRFQPTAWRMGHALRLLLTREHHLDGTVEMDEFYIGGSPRKDADRPRLGRDAKASLGPRRHRFLPSCKGRRMPTRARRPATPGQGLSPICPSPRPVGC